jgi:hypothetical protein
MGRIAPPHAATAERFTRGADGKYISDPRGNIIAPASAEQGRIAKLDPTFAERAAHNRLCSICAGEIANDGVCTFIQSEGAEPPMHVRCAFYAALACPHMRAEGSSPDGLGFLLAADYEYYAPDGVCGEGVFAVASSTSVHLTYREFIGYARTLTENPTFLDAAAYGQFLSVAA